MVLAFGFLNAIHIGAVFTLGPAVAKETIGEQGWGLVLSAESVGLLLMTVVLLRVPLQRPLLLGMLGISAARRADGPARRRSPAGAPDGRVLRRRGRHRGLLMGWNLAMQENIEDSMLSRAYSYDALGSFVAMPVGQLAYGPLGAAFGYEEVLGRLRDRVRRRSACSPCCRGRCGTCRVVRRLDEPSGQPAA